MEEELHSFLGQWSSHGATMEAAAQVVNDYFIVVALNESNASASGCGIDKLVRKIQDLETMFTISLLNRQWVVYLADQWTIAPLHQFWALRKAGLVNADTPVVNNLIQNIGEWKKAWIVPFHLSWHQEMWGKQSELHFLKVFIFNMVSVFLTKRTRKSFFW